MAIPGESQKTRRGRHYACPLYCDPFFDPLPILIPIQCSPTLANPILSSPTLPRVDPSSIQPRSTTYRSSPTLPRTGSIPYHVAQLFLCQLKFHSIQPHHLFLFTLASLAAPVYPSCHPREHCNVGPYVVCLC